MQTKKISISLYKLLIIIICSNILEVKTVMWSMDYGVTNFITF